MAAVPPSRERIAQVYFESKLVDECFDAALSALVQLVDREVPVVARSNFGNLKALYKRAEEIKEVRRVGQLLRGIVV